MDLIENESKVFHPSYDTRNRFMAYRLQEKYGNFDPSKAKPLGPLDIIGKDRRFQLISRFHRLVLNQLFYTEIRGSVSQIHHNCRHRRVSSNY